MALDLVDILDTSLDKKKLLILLIQKRSQSLSGAFLY